MSKINRMTSKDKLPNVDEANQNIKFLAVHEDNQIDEDGDNYISLLNEIRRSEKASLKARILCGRKKVQ